MSQIWTIGHWTCPEETFIALLDGQGIQTVADVRSQPGSRHNPQFDQDSMRAWLERAGIGYLHLAELGGRRSKQGVAAEVNAGWRVTSFKNYADYTLTPDYEHGIARLIETANVARTVCLCAEPTPWRCHRLLISNTLVVRGITVRHIIGTGTVREHELGKWGAAPSVCADGQIIYPAPD